MHQIRFGRAPDFRNLDRNIRKKEQAMKDINGLHIVEVPGVSQDTARELMFHHLGLAAAYFEPCGEDKEFNRQELHRQFAQTFVGENHPTFRAGTAFLDVMHDAFDEIDRDMQAQGFPKLDPAGSKTLETARLPTLAEAREQKAKPRDLASSRAEGMEPVGSMVQTVKSDGTKYRRNELRSFTSIELETLKRAKVLDMNDPVRIRQVLGVRLYLGEHGTLVIVEKPQGEPAKSRAQVAAEIHQARRGRPPKDKADPLAGIARDEAHRTFAEDKSTGSPVKPDRFAAARAAKAALKAKKG